MQNQDELPKLKFSLQYHKARRVLLTAHESITAPRRCYHVYLLLIFVFLSGVLEVQLLDTANLSLDSPDLDDAALDGGDSSVFLFSNVQLTQQVRLD